jgi:hypothetical protein
MSFKNKRKFSKQRAEDTAGCSVEGAGRVKTARDGNVVPSSFWIISSPLMERTAHKEFPGIRVMM